ncbi:Ig-like domain-containing protein [Marinobacterium rhizophilum]|uniref:Cadherin-like domain-containing protein n=1 Tax=Marinobacterium rhizophilum TaxID=420402 RepID=A0ABY5HM05_9GAMM|nr:Ig-like domain-containing protein [Marinobacterium rhizophilum]UTW13426.1 cadherin-like domain-containing protein [Marinobacterium rhizophilum]
MSAVGNKSRDRRTAEGEKLSRIGRRGSFEKPLFQERLMRLSRPFFTQPLTITSLVAALSLNAFPAFSDGLHQSRSKPSAAVEQRGSMATEQTAALLASFAQWQRAERGDKLARVQQLLDLAEGRRDLMLELMGSEAQQVLDAALSDATLRTMPAEVRDLLERPVELEGELEAVYEDGEEGGSKLRQYIKTAFGERFELHITGNGHSVLSGQQASLKGLLFPPGEKARKGGDVVLESGDLLIMGATSGDNNGTAGPLPNTLGERKVAVIMVNFQDFPDDKPWTATEAGDLVFGPVSSFLQENSYNQTWLGGDVMGWYTVSMDGYSSCPSGYDIAADTLAEAAGHDLTQYDHRVYLLPPDSACNGNLATVGGNPMRAWINSGLNFSVIAHELGHNLGLYHAHGLNCEGGVLESNCLGLTYGDSMDIMGNEQGHMNSFAKARLGWLDYDQSPPITTVTEDGTYTISPIETDDNNSKALKILKGIDDATGQQEWYYLEYRQPEGFDGYLFDPMDPFRYPDNLRNGVVIRSAVDGNGDSSYLLDMTPDSQSGVTTDMRDPALETGIVFHDTVAGITIAPLSNDAGGITVSVSFDGGSGDPLNSAPVAVDDAAATSQETTVTIPVLANDYDVDGDVLSITSVDGVNGSAVISAGNIVFTPNTGFSGSSSFSYTVEDGKGASASAAVTVSVAAVSSNQAPIARDDSATTDKNTAVTIDVLANDQDPDGDTLQIVGVTQGGKGSVIINSDDTLTFVPAKNFRNSDTFTYTIADGSLTASASVTVTPASGGDSGGDSGGKGNGKNK